MVGLGSMRCGCVPAVGWAMTSVNCARRWTARAASDGSWTTFGAGATGRAENTSTQNSSTPLQLDQATPRWPSARAVPLTSRKGSAGSVNLNRAAGRCRTACTPRTAPRTRTLSAWTVASCRPHVSRATRLLLFVIPRSARQAHLTGRGAPPALPAFAAPARHVLGPDPMHTRWMAAVRILVAQPAHAAITPAAYRVLHPRPRPAQCLPRLPLRRRRPLFGPRPRQPAQKRRRIPTIPPQAGSRLGSSLRRRRSMPVQPGRPTMLWWHPSLSRRPQS
jgi:hypothetical protein